MKFIDPTKNIDDVIKNLEKDDERKGPNCANGRTSKWETMVMHPRNFGPFII